MFETIFCANGRRFGWKEFFLLLNFLRELAIYRIFLETPLWSCHLPRDRYSMFGKSRFCFKSDSFSMLPTIRYLIYDFIILVLDMKLILYFYCFYWFAVEVFSLPVFLLASFLGGAFWSAILVFPSFQFGFLESLKDQIR